MYEDFKSDSGKVGAMIRNMVGDIGVSFQDTLKTLYKDENGELTETGEVCCKWHWAIAKYAVNPLQMRGYVSIIQTCYEQKINLDKLKSWKAMMRVILPEEFLMKMETFATQVPKLAIMDDTHSKREKKEIRHSSEITW